MSQGAVTFLYTGDANSVQKNTAPCDIAKWSLLFYNHDDLYNAIFLQLSVLTVTLRLSDV